MFKFRPRTGVTSGDPGPGKVVYNNVNQTSSTQLLIDVLDDDNLDVSIGLAVVGALLALLVGRGHGAGDGVAHVQCEP